LGRSSCISLLVHAMSYEAARDETRRAAYQGSGTAIPAISYRTDGRA
jgi:hypothetical protein